MRVFFGNIQPHKYFPNILLTLLGRSEKHVDMEGSAGEIKGRLEPFALVQAGPYFFGNIVEITHFWAKTGIQRFDWMPLSPSLVGFQQIVVKSFDDAC